MKTIQIKFTVQKTDVADQFNGNVTLSGTENKEIYFKYFLKITNSANNINNIDIQFANSKEYFNINGSMFLVLFNKLTNRQQKIFSLLIVIMPNIFDNIKIPKTQEVVVIRKNIEIDDEIYKIIFKKMNNSGQLN